MRRNSVLAGLRDKKFEAIHEEMLDISILQRKLSHYYILHFIKIIRQIIIRQCYLSISLLR